MDKKEVEIFDDFAVDYRKIHTKNIKKISGTDSNFFSEYKIKELFDRKIIKQHSKLLDFGCGDGNTSKYVKKYYPDASYFGVDISEESINQAKEKYGKYGKFIKYDNLKLPFKDETFDIIFIACVMHHIPIELRMTILKECKRVLKKGGKLIIFEHNPYNPLTLKIVNTCPFDENAVLLSPHYSKKLLKNIFSKITLKYTFFFPRKKIFKPILWLEKYLYFLPIGGQYYTVCKK